MSADGASGAKVGDALARQAGLANAGCAVLEMSGLSYQGQDVFAGLQKACIDEFP